MLIGRFVGRQRVVKASRDVYLYWREYFTANQRILRIIIADVRRLCHVTVRTSLNDSRRQWRTEDFFWLGFGTTSGRGPERPRAGVDSWGRAVRCPQRNPTKRFLAFWFLQKHLSEA